MKKLLIFSLILIPFFAEAASYYVEPTTGSSSESEAGRSLRELIKTDVSSEGHAVMSQTDQAQWILEPGLLKMGQSYIVTLAKKQNGSIVFSQKLKASSLSDLDTVSLRLVKAVTKNQNIDSTQQVDSVTRDEETGTTVKTEVTKQFYFGFGPGSVENVKSDKAGVNWTLGYLWGLDHNFSLRLGLQGTSAEGDASMTSFGLGGQYYLNLDKHGPYALGLIGYSWTEANAEQQDCTIFCGISEHGWSAELGVGMHFFRTAKVNFAVEFAYTQGFYTILDESPGVYNGRILVLW